MKLKEGYESHIDDTPRCACCETPISYECCIECNKLIKTFDSFMCYGPKGSNWHMCKDCDDYLANLTCPECGSHKLNRWGIDTDKGKKIVNECKECTNKWETKPR